MYNELPASGPGHSWLVWFASGTSDFLPSSVSLPDVNHHSPPARPTSKHSKIQTSFIKYIINKHTIGVGKTYCDKNIRQGIYFNYLICSQ